MSTQPPPPSPDDRELPRLVDDEGDRISVTDVNGTVARFEMTYSPPDERGRKKYGPPVASRIPSALYLVAAVILGGVILYGYTVAATGTRLFAWIVEGDRGRPLSAGVLAAVVVVSAMGTVLRTHMRGVVLDEDWVEARYLLPLGIPRARRWAWTQVLRVVLDGPSVALELWDGSFERLPEVAKGSEMANAIVRHAERRRIDVTVLDATIPR